MAVARAKLAPLACVLLEAVRAQFECRKWRGKVVAEIAECSAWARRQYVPAAAPSPSRPGNRENIPPPIATPRDAAAMGITASRPGLSLRGREECRHEFPLLIQSSPRRGLRGATRGDAGRRLSPLALPRSAAAEHSSYETLTHNSLCARKEGKGWTRGMQWGGAGACSCDSDGVVGRPG